MKKISFGRWSVTTYPGFQYILNTDDVEVIQPISKSVFTLYDGDIRKYHNAYHPIFMLEYAKENNINLTYSQILAIIFHDVIYVPGYSQNEEKSAEYMKALLTPYITNKTQTKTLNTAYNIILDTKLHFVENPKLREKQSKIVLDLDLINLSLEYPIFKKWNDAVSYEYPNLPAHKRYNFLKFLLKKPSILLSNQLQSKETNIRNNLNKIIEEQYHVSESALA